MNSELTILYVDDSIVKLKATAERWKELGSITMETSISRAEPYIPINDVVITDWQMPDGGGLMMVLKCMEHKKPCFIHTDSPDKVPAEVVQFAPLINTKADVDQIRKMIEIAIQIG